MKPAESSRNAKLLAAMALLAFIGSGAWVLTDRAAIQGLLGADRPRGYADADPQSRAPRLPADESADCANAPAAPSSGTWTVDPFVPPAHFQRHGVKSTASGAAGAKPNAGAKAPGFELRAVRRKPFRLQLAGYFGGPEEYVVAFVGQEVRQTFTVRPGYHFAELGLRFKSFEVRKGGVGSTAPTPDSVGVAVVVDERAGTEVTLDSHACRYSDDLLAVIASPGEPDRDLQLAEGDVVVDGGVSYRLERIQLSPPEVALVRMGAGRLDSQPTVLRPRGSVAVAKVMGGDVETNFTKRVVSNPP